MIRLPNFLIIGAPRSGTTLLYRTLAEHPDIFMSPVKEPHFFIEDSKMCLEDYQALFRGVTSEKAIGEASTLYLYSPKSSSHIKKNIPNARLIAVLRNPVERAYSQYLHHLRQGYEPMREFRGALEAESLRKRMGLSPFNYYKEVGLYSEQILRYQRNFYLDQLLIFLYEDLINDSHKVFSQILNFLEINPDFPIDISVNFNPSGHPRNHLLHQFLTKNNWIKDYLKIFIPKKVQEMLYLRVLSRSLVKRPMDDDIREMLLDYYHDDIQKTSSLIGCDLSHWLA